MTAEVENNIQKNSPDRQAISCGKGNNVLDDTVSVRDMAAAGEELFCAINKVFASQSCATQKAPGIIRACAEILRRGGDVYPAHPIRKNPFVRYTQVPGISSLEVFDNFIKKGNKVFVHVPARAGLLALDIDRKNERDGLASLREKGIDPDVLLKDHPHALTPGTGIHVYFSYNGEPVLNNEILRGVEVKHSNLLTVPGSTDHRGEYRLVGSLASVQPIPESIRALLIPRNRRSEEAPARSCRHDVSFDKMIQTLRSQGYHFTPGSDFNNSVYHFALWAAKDGKAPGDVLRYIQDTFRPTGERAAGMRPTIAQAYKGRKF